MKLVAIDFETADHGADSACALGIATIEDGTIAKQAYSLIRPPRRNFVFTYIHGIAWRDVEAAPSFDEVWEDFREHWSGADYLIAHNAAFDRNVLLSCGGGRTEPAPPFICTVRVARSHWNFRPANLAHVCSQLGIPLKHHDAGSDAFACAAIALRAINEGFPIHTAALSARNS